MSYCKDFGKDRVIFETKEDQEKPVSSDVRFLSVTLDKDEEPGKKFKRFKSIYRSSSIEGLILPNGDINWNCPCMGGMVSGPCGYEFREAFTCFHYSKAERRGSDCVEHFQKMGACMAQYPNLYPGPSDEDEDNEADDADDPMSAIAGVDAPLEDSASSSAMSGFRGHGAHQAEPSSSSSSEVAQKLL